MSREAWTLIKHHKNFNVNVYRRGLAVLTISLIINSILGALMFYEYIREPERDYYATSGITAPVQLKSMPTPNMSSEALLDPDPSSDNDLRVIPQ